MRWYRIMPQTSLGLGHPFTIPDVYIERRVLPVGTLIPESFKGLADIENIYIPANYLTPYEPDESDTPMLYMLWPQTRPRGYSAEWQENAHIGELGQWANAWYEIAAPSVRNGHIGQCSIPYGVSALMTLEGICKVGQVALVGDIVPAAFFAGLNAAQFEQFERMGLVAHQWLNEYSPSQRAEYMRELAWPVMRRVYPNREELKDLVLKFPAMDTKPKQEIAVSTATPSTEDAPQRAKSRKDK